MKRILLLMLLMASPIIMACPVCDRNQPKVTMGLTHGVGPSSNWDWFAIGLTAVAVVLALVYSIKLLVRPKPEEKDENHIKQTILNEF